MGHTIVLSRGLVDVLPDEASLAAILAHELGHVVLRHRMGTQYAFFNRLRFDEKETFHHFGFTHTPEEEQAATQKGIELLKKSPYQDHIGNAQLFLQALNDRSKEIPNLVSPHLGNRVATSLTSTSAVPIAQASASKPAGNLIAALPLGGRIKIDPGTISCRCSSPSQWAGCRKRGMPFELTPLVFYLTRQRDNSSPEAPGVAKLASGTKP